MFIFKSTTFWIALATTGLAALGFFLGIEPNLDVVIAIALSLIIVIGIVKLTILTAKQMAQVLVIMTALALLVAHFALGISWEQIPAHAGQLVDQLGQIYASFS
jgi:hypothetical protein